VSEVDDSIDPRQVLLFSEYNQKAGRAYGFVVRKRIGIAQEAMGQTSRSFTMRGYSNRYERGKARPPRHFNEPIRRF